MCRGFSVEPFYMTNPISIWEPGKIRCLYKIDPTLLSSYVTTRVLCVTLNGQMVVMGNFVDVIRGS